MGKKWSPPTVSLPDAEGFQTFSFYTTDIGETLRVSFNPGRHREYLAKTGSDTDLYHSTEFERLRTAAAIIAAHDDFPAHDPKGALAAIINLVPKYAAQNLETYFPSLALLALQLANDICLKHTLNRVVQSMRAPRIYDEAMLDLLFEELMQVSKGLLEIGAGRPVETGEYLKRVRNALKRLDRREHLRGQGKRPTQQQVADELEIEPRTLRKWRASCGLSWNEFLRACGWTIKAEPN